MKKSLLICLLAACLVSACAGPETDSLAIARVFTWEDVNANGKPDEGEPPIPFVTTSVGYPDMLTAINGWGSTGKFVPGCEKDCWRGEFVRVKVPPEFEPTTATEYELTLQEGNYLFGFQIDNQHKTLPFPKEPVWQRAFINRGTKLLAFHYTETSTLEITVDREATVTNDYYPESYLGDQFYFSIFVFDVVLRLKSMEQAPLSALRLTIMPGGETYTCKVDDIAEWAGRISGPDFLKEHCEHN